eukprot:s606_g2.t1
MAPCPESLLSLTLNCPALGIQSSFVLRLKNCEGDELLECINDFRRALRSKDLITLEKGEMCSSQELMIDSWPHLVQGLGWIAGSLTGRTPLPAPQRVAGATATLSADRRGEAELGEQVAKDPSGEPGGWCW